MFSIWIVILGLLGITQRSECQCKEICPDGWIRFQDSCYFLGFEQDFTFVESYQFCHQHHAYLIHVETSMENAFVKDYLKKTRGDVWIGLSDIDIEGLWRWYSNDKIVKFTDWYPGQPGSDGEEDCAVFGASTSNQWHDASCTSTYHPLCEKNLHDQVLSIVG